MASWEIKNKKSLTASVSPGNKQLTGTISSGSGTADHNRLTNRTKEDQHPIEAISGLRAELDSKLNSETATPLINKALTTRAAGLYYDAKKELARKSYWYLTSKIDEVTGLGIPGDRKEYIISGPYDLGMGGGSGSGGGGVTSITVKQVDWPAAAAVGDATTPTKIKVTWSSTIGEDKTPTGNGTVYLLVNNKQVEILPKQPQGEVTLDVSKYLVSGENKIEVRVLDTYGTTGLTIGTINGINLILKSEFNSDIPYRGRIDYTYIPVGNVEKIVHFIVDGKEIGTQRVTASGVEQHCVLRNLKHGACTLEVYFEATIVAGEKPIESNHLFYELIFVEDGNTTPIIASNFNEFTQSQYVSFKIPYRVFIEGRTMATVTLKADGKVISEENVTTAGVHPWVYRADIPTIELNDKNEVTWSKDPLVLEIICGEVVKEFKIDIIKNKISVSPEDTGLELALSAYGRSNGDTANRNVWTYTTDDEIKPTTYSCTFNNFNWSSDGWLLDEKDINVLRVGGNARLEIPIKVFENEIKSTGKTIELEIATRNIRDYNTTIISCLDKETSPFYTVEILHQDEEIRKNGFKVEYNYGLLRDSRLTLGKHLITYTENGWTLNGQTANLANYGITLTPIVLNPDGDDKGIKPLVGDRILVNYSLEARGFEITPQVASIRSQQSFLSTQYKEDEHIRIAFVVETTTQNRIIWMYINGVASGAMQYPEDDSFKQESPSFITIGSSDATVDIYNIRVYNSALISKQIVNNWIADTADMGLKAQRFNHNNIVNEDNLITVESLAGNGHSELPYIIWGMEKLPQSKDDDVFKSGTSARYVDPTDSNRNFKAIDCEYKIQGTSSAVYPTKNIRMRTKKGKGGPKLEWYDDDGNDLIIENGGPGFPITTPNGIGVDYFTFKVDYASSEGANNVELTKLYNDASIKYGLLTPPQYAQYKVNNDTNDITVRVGIDGFPVAAFHESKDGISFLTKANFNNDKANPDVYGFADGDESWETTNNSAAEAKYQKPVTVDNFENGFEIRFPDKDGYNNMSKLGPMTAWVYSTYRDKDNTRVVTDLNTEVTIPYEDVVITDNTQENISFRYNTETKDEVEKIVSITFTKDTNDYRLSKFKHELKDYFNVDSCLFYYLFTELFLMIDSRAKNAFPTYFATRTNELVKDKNGNEIPNNYTDGGNRWFWIPYDMDTAIGIDNKGKLTFDYSLEDTDQLDGADVYNGQTSVMWCNIRDAFKAELASMYSTLRVQGLISYDTVESRFTEHQGKWPEVLLNQDAVNKYIVPLTKGDNYLEMLQGTKEQQRKWWLYNRFKYMDSKYNAGDSKADFVQFRAYVDMGEEKPNLEITPYASIYATASFGNGSKYLISQRIEEPGTKAVLENPFGLKDDENDQETYIYSASQLKSIGDISPFHPDTVKIGNAIRLQELKVGDASPDYSNPHLKELTVGANTLLKTIDARNCINLGTGTTVSPDLRGCTNIEEIYFTGTKIKGIQLPDGGTIKTLHLPGTLKSLKIQNQPSLTDLVIESTNTTINKGVTVSEEQAYLFAGFVIKKEPWNEITANAVIYLADSIESEVNTTDCIRISIENKNLYDSLIEKKSLLNVRSTQIDARYDLFENDEIRLIEYAARFTTFPTIEAVGRGIEIKTLLTHIKEFIVAPELKEFKESLIESLWLQNIPSSAIQAREFIKNMKEGSSVCLIGINETFEDIETGEGTYKAWEQVKDFYDLLDKFKGVDTHGNGEIDEKAQVTGIINIDKISYRNYVELTNRYPEIIINAKQIGCIVSFYKSTDYTEEALKTETVIVPTELTTKNQLNILGRLVSAPQSPTKESTVSTDFTFSHWYDEEGTIWTGEGQFNIVKDTIFTADYTPTTRIYNVTFDINSDKVKVTPTSVEVAYGKTVPMPTISIPEEVDPEEVEFMGWAHNDVSWTFEGEKANTVVGETHLVAKWKDRKVPTIDKVERLSYNSFKCYATDNLGIIAYALIEHPDEPTKEEWVPIEATTSLEKTNTIDHAGEYYFWIKDANTEKDVNTENTMAKATVVAHSISVQAAPGSENYSLKEGETVFNADFALNGTELTLLVDLDDHYKDLSYTINGEKLDLDSFSVYKDIQINLSCTPKDYEIRFDLGKDHNGDKKGDPDKAPAQTITYLDKVTKPGAQYWQKTGEIIKGWYSQPNFADDSYWDFENYVVKGDMTLYAKWESYLEPTILTIEVPTAGEEIVISYSQYKTDADHKVSVDWGDGTIDSTAEKDKLIKATHTYSTAGTKIIKITGTGGGDASYLLGNSYGNPLVAPIAYLKDIELACDINTLAIGALAKSSLKHTRISEYITEISIGCYSGCTQLESIEIPENVLKIHDQAFSGCSGATGKVKLPANIQKIGSNAFEYCSNITSFELLCEHTPAMYDLICRGCSNLTSFKISDHLPIAARMFERCISLTEIDIKNKTVEQCAFRNCQGLLKVTSSAEYFENRVFEGCSNLQTVILTNPKLTFGVATWTVLKGGIKYSETGAGIFDKCSKLKTYGPITDLSNPSYNVNFAWNETIPAYAFQRSALNPDDIMTITDIILPEGIKTIGSHAFCNAVALTSIDLPDSLKTIEDNAFRACQGLNSIIIPTVSDMQQNIFANCIALSEVWLKNASSTTKITNPEDSWFLNTNHSMKLYIPDSLEAAIGGVAAQYGSDWNACCIKSDGNWFYIKPQFWNDLD